MLDDMNSVIHGAERYLGVPRCSADKGDLKKVNDLLQAAKPNWKTFSYDTITKMTSGDVVVTQTWNGAAYRMREKMPSVKFAFTKEIMEGLDGQRSRSEERQNVENAEAVPELHHGPGECGPDLGLRAMTTASSAATSTCRQFRRSAEPIRRAERVHAAVLAGGGRDLQPDLDQPEEVDSKPRVGPAGSPGPFVDGRRSWDRQQMYRWGRGDAG